MAGIVVSVEYLEVTLDATLDVVSTDLTKGQDDTKCVPMFVTHLNSAGQGDNFVERTVEVTIGDNGGTAEITLDMHDNADADDKVYGVFVVEFSADINVNQYNVAALTDTSIAQTITSVGATTDAFMVYYGHCDTAVADDFNAAYIRLQFASTTSVTISRDDNQGQVDGTLFVVDCDSGEFTVEHKDYSTSGASVDTTVTAVVLADTFTIHTYTIGHGTDDLLHGVEEANLVVDPQVFNQITVGKLVDSGLKTAQVNRYTVRDFMVKRL